MDPRQPTIEDGALAVTDGRIADVGSTTSLRRVYEPARLLDACEGLVHPGFIDPHHHVTFHNGRGFLAADDVRMSEKAFDSWENELTEQDEHDSALSMFTEALRCGYTTVQEPGTAYEPDAVARAAVAAGIRCFVADPYLWDVAGPHPSSNRAPVERGRCMQLLGGQLWRNRRPDGLVRGYVSIYGAGTASDELTLAAKTCAREHNVVFSSHQSFSVEDREFDHRRYGRPPIQHLAELGILDHNTVLTHMNVLDDAEADAVLQSETIIAWNPTNYLFYSISLESRSQVPEIIRRGGCVALCNDIAKAWTLTDEQLIAYFAARNEGTALTVHQLFETLTLGGARAVGMGDELGCLAEGRRADLVIHRSDHPLLEPNTRPELQMLLVSRCATVDKVFVAGRMVVENGHCVLVDEAAVHARTQASAKRLVARVNATIGSPVV